MFRVNYTCTKVYMQTAKILMLPSFLPEEKMAPIVPVSSDTRQICDWGKMRQVHCRDPLLRISGKKYFTGPEVIRPEAKTQLCRLLSGILNRCVLCT